MNKNTKIRLNYLAGAAISIGLLCFIYNQVTRQLSGIEAGSWRHTGAGAYLYCCIGLMFVNTTLEGIRWYLLTGYAEPVSYPRAFASYLAGVAFSVITPNRVGEYPGRILYLGRVNTLKYINVSILGIAAQLWSVYLFGLGALIYYNIAFPAMIAKVALVVCLLANVLAGIVYWQFESWVPKMGRNKWLRKFAVYGKLLQKITKKKQIIILAISLLRFTIFTAQYLFLLRWMNVDIPMAEGFWMAALFFWILAVVPSIALTELGVRGEVSIFLFQHFSANTVGVLAATAGIWVLNLIIPSIVGSILIFRMRIIN